MHKSKKEAINQCINSIVHNAIMIGIKENENKQLQLKLISIYGAMFPNDAFVNTDQAYKRIMEKLKQQ